MTANGSKWQARIGYGGKNHYLGSFNTKEEAAAVYDTAARERKGSDAVCNFENAEAAAAAVSVAVAEWEQQNPPQPKPRPVSGFYGVAAASGSKWLARISYGGNHHLGCFNTVCMLVAVRAGVGGCMLARASGRRRYAMEARRTHLAISIQRKRQQQHTIQQRESAKVAMQCATLRVQKQQQRQYQQQ